MTSSKIFKYIRLEDAFDKIDLHVVPALSVEYVRTSDAYGRFLAEDVVSEVNLPPRDTSHFDGYALKSSDVACASPANPVKLRIKSKAFPSTSEEVCVERGEAVYVATGSFMPLGADGVLPVEAAVVKGDYVEVRHAVKPGDHVIKAGSDVKRGEGVLRRGHRLRGQDLALLALLGFTRIKVVSRPKVCIIPVGDELTDYYEVAKPGRVPCSHVLIISSFVLRDGGLPVYFGVAPDDVAAIVEAVTRAANCFDLVLTIGGVSRGERDLVCEAVSKIEGAKIVFHGVMTRPGRQTAFAVIRNKPIIMLPGLPQSTIVGYQLIARRAMFRLMGVEAVDLLVKAKIACDLKLPLPKGFKRIIFTKLEEKGDDYLAWPVIGESALLSVVVRSNGYAIFSEGVEKVDKGSIIDVHLLY